jgi:hypothetical protein
VHGHILHGYDARFSWPGFFSLMAFVSRASGRTDAVPLLNWAPLVLAGLATLGMRALARQVLGDSRAAWIATWLFVLAEWTEQDYFSPQAVTYVMLLAGLAITFRYLVKPGRADKAACAIVVVIALALAPSHQLTPYVFGGLLLIVLVTRRLTPAWLPLVILIPAVLWFVFGARDFWQGHLDQVFGGIGHIGTSVHQGLGARFVGDAGRTFLLKLRVGLTVFMGLLAAAGSWVQRRRGIRSWTLPLLAAVPFTLAGMQSYGGEIFLRSYLFALPFAAILGAVAIDAFIGTGQWRRCAVPIAVTFVLLSGLGLATVTARGGNDAYTSISRADVAAMNYVYRQVRPGQSIDSLFSDAPMRFDDVGTVPQNSFDNCPDMTDMPRCVLAAQPDYLVITPSQDNHGRIFFGLRPGWTDDVVRKLVATGRYRQVFDEDGSLVLARQS